MKKRYIPYSPDPTDHPDLNDPRCNSCGDYCDGECEREHEAEARNDDRFLERNDREEE